MLDSINLKGHLLSWENEPATPQQEMNYGNGDYGAF
jgi:hypothetical protein